MSLIKTLRKLVQRTLCADRSSWQPLSSPDWQPPADFVEDPRIDNRAARRLAQESIDFNYRTSLHNPAEFTLAGYGGEFPGGRMYITAVW